MINCKYHTQRQEAIRTLLQRCNEAEAESGRTSSIREALQHQKVQVYQCKIMAAVSRLFDFGGDCGGGGEAFLMKYHVENQIG